MGRGSYLGGSTIVGPRSGWFAFSHRRQESTAYPSPRAAKALAARELEYLRRSSAENGAASRGSNRTEPRTGAGAEPKRQERVAELQRQLREARQCRERLAKAEPGSGAPFTQAIEQELLDEHIRDLTALIRRLEA